MTPVDLTPLSDEALMALVGRGQAQAIAALYDRHATLVFSVVLRVLSERTVAEEVTQDAFMNVWRAAATYQSQRGAFVPWLLSVARNRAIDELRRRRSRTATEQAVMADGMAAALSEAAAAQNDPHLNRLAVHDALAQLPADQRRALEMAYFVGLTQQEIAEELREPLGTVKTRIRLGMQKLRAILEEQAA